MDGGLAWQQGTGGRVQQRGMQAGKGARRDCGADGVCRLWAGGLMESFPTVSPPSLLLDCRRPRVHWRRVWAVKGSAAPSPPPPTLIQAPSPKAPMAATAAAQWPQRPHPYLNPPNSPVPNGVHMVHPMSFADVVKVAEQVVQHGGHPGGGPRGRHVGEPNHLRLARLIGAVG